MSEENVDVVRACIDAMNRRDIPGVLDYLDPGIRFEHRLAALEGSFVGIEGVKGWFGDLVDSFETWHIDCPDIRDLGDRVLALGTLQATGKESGAPAELPLTAVARISGGLITEFVDFGDKNQALEAVGLSE